nr:hypothetical protein [Tanacetum cinerariifolium]
MLLGKFLLRRQGSSRSLLLPNSRLSLFLPKNLLRRKAPAKADRGKSIELLFDAALLEDAQLKKTLRKSKRETHKLQASGSSEGADFKLEVPDEPTGKTKDTSERTDESDDVHDEDDNDDDSGNDDDGGNDAQDSEQTNSDDDKNPSFTLNDYEEEEQDEEYVHTLEKDKSDNKEKMSEEDDDDVTKELYGDLNITQGLKDADMTNLEQGEADQQNASHESGFVHEEEDAHVTLTIVHDKTEGIPNFESLYQFDQRVSALETKVSEFNQTSQFAEVVSLIPSIVDIYLVSKLKEEVNVVVQLQSNKLREKARAENQEFLNQVDSTMKEIIKEQVKAQVSKIMPQIEKYVTESLGAKVLVRSTNQPQTSYAVAASLSEFKLKKILIDKMETNKSINRSDIPNNLYNALVKAYNSDKDNFTSYIDDKDPSVGSDLGTKRRKSSKNDEPSKGSKSSSSCKGTQSQPKSLGKSTQAEEPEFKAADTEMQQDQGNESGHIDDQPYNEAAPKYDWFQKPGKPLTPDRDWNKSKSVDFRPPQKWISTIAKARQSPRTFDELMGTTIDFSAYVMNRLKIDNLTHEIFVGRGFNLLKGTCKSFGHAYPFDLSNPLSLIKDQGRQVVPASYFINNDLENLKGGSSSSKYATSTTRTKATKYDNIEGIEDMFKEGDFSKLNLCDIEEMLLLLVQKKLFNLDIDYPYDLGVALRMFTRRIVILHRVKYLQFLEMDYLPKRHWSNLEKKRSRIMIKAIDKLLFERMLMRNLETFVGGREYENDLRLLEQTI